MTDDPARDHIIREIRRIAAANGGQAPGQNLFARETGMEENHWRGKYWARWGDALAAAGFEANKWNEKHAANDVLIGFVAACRHFDRLPTTAETDLYRRSNRSAPTSTTIRRHFAGRDGLIAALRAFVVGKPEMADVVTMLPPEIESSADARPTLARQAREGFVYLIQSGDFYKIGRSDDIERRVKEIRVALPDKAVLIHSIRTDDPAGIEAYWHQRFADRRANCEWFKLSALDLSAIKKRKFQ